MTYKRITASIIITTLCLNTLIAEEHMPLEASPGQCFTKAFYPPKVKKVIKTVSTKRIKLSESAVKYKVIPPEYTWIEKRIKVSDGKEKIIVSPAVYDNVVEKILVKPSKRVWRQHGLKAKNSCVQSASSFGFDIDTVAVGTCYYEHYEAAEYRNIIERILTSPASSRVVAIPAKYKTITKKIVTSNSTMKLVPVPIKYKKVKENVTIEPARSEWRKTTCHDRGCDQSEVVCLTEVPRTFKTVTKKVILQQAVAKKVAVEPVYTYVKAEMLVTPATTKTIPIPATYKTVTKQQKIKEERYFWTDNQYQNASTRLRSECDKICLVETPAVYKTISKRVEVQPATIQKVKTPEKYTTVKIKKVTKKASFKTITVPSEYLEVKVEKERTKGFAKWIPVICEEAMDSTLVKKIQQALQYQGYYYGEIDGNWGYEEKAAVREYQKANGLARAKLSIETMKSLGIY